jgi:redox-sensitive bicupin YhaK (pirin superfamily)
MSNLERTPGVNVVGGRTEVAVRPVHEVFAGREVQLGESTRVRRLLPNLGRRLVGPWCFVDHYGPEDVVDRPGMQVPPHPHIGLQTVSWLLDGEVRHRDSLGSDQVIAPGGLGLMTSGAGIAHSEYSPVPRPELLHGAQLWVALPEGARAVDPSWEYHGHLPTLTEAGLVATVIMGELAGERSPGRAYSPIVGADLALAPGADALVPLEPDFEYALLAMAGTADVEGTTVAVGSMVDLGCGRHQLRLQASAAARLLLLGGEPFAEQIVMWWNFVARSTEEITHARDAWRDVPVADWMAGVAPLAPPPLPPGRLRPGGAVR